jgi:hypothetical protein
MKTQAERNSNLDGIDMAEVDRIVAEAYLRRGEFVAEMLIRMVEAVRAFGNNVVRGVVNLFRPRQVN